MEEPADGRGDSSLEGARLALERDRLAFEREKHEAEIRLAWRKLFVTAGVSAVAAIGIPWIVANQNTNMERLKINAASVEHVQAVLKPDLAPDARRRIYEYLVTAFEGTPLHQWAKEGVNESTQELEKAKRERDEARNNLERVRRDLEMASAAVQRLEDELASTQDDLAIVALEQKLQAAKVVLSDKTKELRQVSIAQSSPMELNANGLGLWKEGEHSKARALFEEACDREYWPACLNLAGALHRGKVKDLEKAEALYRSACAAKRAQACTELGDLLAQQGLGEEALEYYTQGCELGNERACQELVDRGLPPPEPTTKRR
jgi:tetratricopeptide (TPR) repeat protein